MKKSIKIVFLALLLCFSVAFTATSQVTIGTLEIPSKGALLDLKERNVSNGGANSDKGLLLPRVNLTNVSSLSPILSVADLSDAALISNLTGLIVYNVNANAPLKKGLYSWDGTKWNFLSPVAAENGLNVSSDAKVKLGGSLTETTTVDLNNKDLVLSSTTGKLTLNSSAHKFGIGTSLATDTLNIKGRLGIDVPVASQDPMEQYLVVDNKGNIHSRSSTVSRMATLAGGGTTNWVNNPPNSVSDILDFYFIDKTHNLTLPTPSTAYAGKLIRFYIYGGTNTNFVINGVNYPNTWTCSVPGFTYSGSQGGKGTLTITDGASANIYSVRFRFIDIICDGSSWWVNNQ